MSKQIEQFEQQYKTAIQTISQEDPTEKDYQFLATFFSEVNANRNQLQQEDIVQMRSWFLGAMDDE